MMMMKFIPGVGKKPILHLKMPTEGILSLVMLARRLLPTYFPRALLVKRLLVAPTPAIIMRGVKLFFNTLFGPS